MKKTLYLGGAVLTMDKEQKRAEALLTDGGKILAVGKLSDVMRFADGAERIDLRGKTLMPAFVDGHSHILMLGSLQNKCDLSECRSFDEILDAITDFKRKRGIAKGDKISCYGYDLSIIKEGRHPTAEVLDRLGGDNPIGCTHASFHMGTYNSAAMQDAGLDASYEFTGSGRVGRNADGSLNGYFEEGARRVMSAYMSKGTSESFADSLLAAEQRYLENGIATIQEGGSVTEERINKFKAVAESHGFRSDIVLYLEPRLKDPDFWQRALDLLPKDRYESHLKIGGVKMVLDGSPQAKTAWMTKPYEGESEYRGYPNLKDETVYTVLKRATAAGLQTLAHCNGDAASEQFLSAFEKVAAEDPLAKSARPVMIHAQTVRYDQLDRMAEVGMIPSFFIGHTYFWGDTHLKNFGYERGSRISPARYAMDKDLIFNFHQDSPVTKPNMLHSIWCAVNRITRSGITVGEENKLDVYDALIAATHGAAYAYFEEETKGILKPGAVSDLILLDKDPTAVAKTEIKNISVLKTIKGGTVVYEKKC